MNKRWQFIIVMLLIAAVANLISKHLRFQRVEDQLLRSATNQVQTLQAILILQEAVKQLQARQIELLKEEAAMFNPVAFSVPLPPFSTNQQRKTEP